VRDGVVFTPAANKTFLAGITRSRVIGLLRAAGFEVIEATLTMADFEAADEIFTTGNYSKVLPVIRLDERDLQAGPVTAKARDLYMDWAHSSGDM
jgi:branched-chain amino acid aminotransferase